MKPKNFQARKLARQAAANYREVLGNHMEAAYMLSADGQCQAARGKRSKIRRVARGL